MNAVVIADKHLPIEDQYYNRSNKISTTESSHIDMNEPKLYAMYKQLMKPKDH